MTFLRLTLLVLLILYWGLLVTLTHVPKLPPVGPQVSDKTAHFLAYGLLATLLFGTLWAYRPRMRWLPVLVLGIVLAYGAVDEWTQPMFGRMCELADWLADAAGASAATVGLTLVRWVVMRARPRA